MDYEKKYNNAIERAKHAIEDCGDNQGRKEMIYGIFPELAESDDEKIREGLLRHFRNKTKPYWNEIAVKNIIAYLERQEEKPKNADSISADCASSAKCENEHNKPGDFVFELRQIISRHWHADMYGEYTDDEEGMAREILSLCERQNPAEWSEEDEEMLDNVEDSIASDETITDEELNERVAWVRFLVQRIKNTNY